MLCILCVAEKMTSTTVQGSFTVTHYYVVLFIYVTFIYLTLLANTRKYRRILIFMIALSLYEITNQIHIPYSNHHFSTHSTYNRNL